MKRIKELINRPKSFILVCSIYFVIYSILSVLVLLLFENLTSKLYLNLYPETFIIEEHVEELQSENYQKIPMDKYEGSDFIIMDGDYNVLYSTDETLTQDYTPEDTALIADENSYYNFYRFATQSGSQTILVMKCTYDDFDYDYSEDSDSWKNYLSANCSEYCLLDDDLNIIDGTLFAPAKSVTVDQLNLLCGIYDAHRTVYREDYLTDSGETRIILTLQDSRVYNEVSDYDYIRLERLRYISIPVIAGMLICFSVLIIHKLRKSLAPLNRAIVAYSKGERVLVEESKMPLEFRGVVENLDSLLNQLEDSRVETANINAEKQRIISNLSHDLKTPLTVVQGYSLALSEGLVAEEKKQQYYHVMYDRTVAMGELLNALLKYTRLETPEYEVSLKRVDFTELCRRYLSEKYQELELDQFVLDIDIPEQVIMMDIDNKLMRRAFDNLVGNALKYNPEGTVITFRVQDSADTLTVVVADNGVGIPTEIESRAFEPMVSGDKARTGGAFGEGSGIGLSIVRRVIELHHGSITLNDPLEDGFATQFTIHLPKPKQ